MAENGFTPPTSYDLDDTLLLGMYENSQGDLMNKVEDFLATSDSAEKSNRTSKNFIKPGNRMKQWSAGDPCRAVYSFDGELYEANIVEFQDDDMCLVQFLGYHNEELVYATDLRPSKGKISQREQVKAATHSWEISDYCCAPYQKDGKYYEAKIIGFPDENTCSVQFIGYENIEDVLVSSLRATAGQMTRTQQAEIASREQSVIEIPVADNDECSSFSSCYSSMSGASQMQTEREQPHGHRVMSQTESNEYIPSESSHDSHARRHHRSSARPLCTARPSSPPPPAVVPNIHRGVYEDNEAFSALLMSWYMAGYHTGFYKGRNSRSERSCSCGHCCRAHRH